MAADQLYYSLSKDELFRKLDTKEAGLSEAEAKQRLTHYGQNRLTPKKPLSPLAVYFSQFRNSLILILLVSALLILLVWYFGEKEQADLIEASLIVAIVLLITFLGFIQEYKAERAVEALKQLLAYKARVIREGKEQEIDVNLLVPGDLVILEEGMKVPADLRLLEVAILSVNEASLTGESAAVTKTTEPLTGQLQVQDQTNMVFAGTVIAQGRGKGIVVTTGDVTEIGKIASDVAEAPEQKTPIQQRLDGVGRVLAFGITGVATLVFLFIVFFASEFTALSPLQRVLHSAVAAVALAVAAIPEGLPAVVTIALALGTQRMLGRGALVRRLNSTETLGSTDVICADKTGTLTKGEMTVKEIFFDGVTYGVSGAGYETTGQFSHEGQAIDPPELILEAGLLCNNAKLNPDKPLGDPTELALLVAAAKAKIKTDAARVAEVPFSPARKMMSVLVKTKAGLTFYSKGAPEVILGKCQKIIKAGKVVALTSAERQQILEQTQTFSGQALRTLGFAYRPVEQTTSESEELEQDLIFIGLQAMIDPPRGEIKTLISQCKQAGIRVVMITGDHAATGQAVGAEIGITGKVITGAEVDALPEEDFAKEVETINIYARVNPGSKMRIVEALKTHGHIVAMTGDGVNDAPALAKADIGIAMGKTGTDVAKEAADMILLDDHFATIVAAIEEGRGIFDNIKKFVNYLLSCNIGEVLVVFLAILLFQELPLTAVMLLWINIVTDGLPAVALGLDPPEPEIIRRPPKRFQSDIIPPRMWLEMILFGLLLTAGVLWLYQTNLAEGVEEARGVVFMAIVLFELVRLFTIRADYRQRFFSNPWLMAAIGLSILLQLIILYVPTFATAFGIAPIDSRDWLTMILLAGLLGLGFEFARTIFGSGIIEE